MLTFDGRSHSFCDRVNRREFLRVGGLGVGGLTLADLLRAEQKTPSVRPKSIIYVVLGGGPSHIDMWDMKPNAPADIRGPFKPRPTIIPGVQICEHMPAQAKMFDQFALIRGIRSVENDHFLSEVYSGLPRPSGQRPAFGSVVSRTLNSTSALPTYVSLDRPTTDQFEFEKPFYAGAAHAPFRPFGEALDNMKPNQKLERLQDRKSLLHTFDTLRRDLDTGDRLNAMDQFNAQALDIITSPKVREAFDLRKEPPKLIDRYGRGKWNYSSQTTTDLQWDSKPLILARRLVEAGVRIVTVRIGSWDHHSNLPGSIFYSLSTMLPLIDLSITALVTDLRERGLDQDVLVVVLGEFGRSPKIHYPGPGREHWADAGCALFAGGGLKMGQVIGETDSRAERSKSGDITFQNIIATMYQVLGVDPTGTLTDFRGRPQFLLDDPKPIADLDPPPLTT